MTATALCMKGDAHVQGRELGGIPQLAQEVGGRIPDFEGRGHRVGDIGRGRIDPRIEELFQREELGDKVGIDACLLQQELDGHGMPAAPHANIFALKVIQRLAPLER